jgi:hypothetical protein
MRTAPALASAPIAVAAALAAACAYDVPNVVPRSDDAGGSGGDDGGFTAPDGASSSGSDSGWNGSDGGEGGGSGSSSGGGTTDAGCTGTLCTCNNASDCASHICAQSLTVGTSLYAAAGNKNFCTQPCCTSADCASGTVCFASGQGGNYCVNPAWIGRAAPGAGAGGGGASCSTGNQCRSGLCTGSSCADTCCSLDNSASECGGGQCTFGAFPGTGFDTHYTARCGPARGLYDAGVSCSGDDQCQGGLCVSYRSGLYCTNACRTDAECGAGAGCLIDQRGIDVYFACFPSTGSMQGTQCSTDVQCLGDWCIPTSTVNMCSGVCFTDADCTVLGWRCTPQPDQLPTGNYLVLGCGP